MSKDHPNWKDRSQDPDGFARSEQFEVLSARCQRLLHAIQTAIKILREHEAQHGVPEDLRSTGPKHLRVGVDNALIGQGALVALLVEKGVIKYRDYVETLVEFTERELESYKAMVKEHLGIEVNLG